MNRLRAYGMGATAPTTTAPPATNWLLWGSVAVLVGVGGYLYWKRK